VVELFDPNRGRFASCVNRHRIAVDDLEVLSLAA
jgi:hypothetical protein